MKKMRGLLGVLVALFAIAPITIANAATVDSVNVNVTLPSVGSTVTHNSQNYTYTPAVTYSATNADLGDVSQCMFTENPTTAASDPTFTGEVPANTYFWVEFELKPKTGDTFDVDHLVVTVNGSSSNVQVGEWFTSATGGMVYAKIKTGSASTTETEKVKVHYENVKVINSWARPEDQTIDKGSRVTEPVLFDGQYNLYNDEDFIFEGWYADAEFKTEFDFDAAINKDTTIYAKFTKVADIEKKFKEILDAANLSLKSSLQEEYALDLLLDYQRDVLYDSIDDIEIPDFDIDGVTINDKDWYLTYTSIVNGKIEIEYSYNNIYNGHYSYRIPVKYAEADQHDAALDEAADAINNIVYSLEEYDESITLDGLVDFTKIPEFGYEGRVFTKAEVREIYKNSNKKLTNANQFELNVLNENDIDINATPDYSARMESYNTLTKDDIIYAMLYSSMHTRYMVVIDPEVENNHAAYVENVKGKIKAYLESKGYTNIQFDLNGGSFDPSYVLQVFYGEVEYDEQEDWYYGNSFRIYMMKDENTYLLAKNLTVNYNDNNLFVSYAESYSEDKDKMSEESVADIESMKVTLEGEGYDFFDGYEVYSWIPEGNKATLTFTVGTANNNRRFKVLHTLADGTIETFTGIVKDGQFSIDVTETSPFAVGLGEVVKATKNNPQTFDPIILSVLMLALSAIGLIGGSIYLTKSRLN